MFTDINVAADVELIRSLVEKRFRIYEVHVSYQAVTVMADPMDKETLGADFDQLRKELKAKDFIPFINYSGGEYAIAVIRKPPIQRRTSLTNKILLLATFITTTFAGMVWWADYNGTGDLLTLSNFANGALYFAVPLMAILGVHEYCHYWAAKRHGVEASLPFFIPSIPPFGSFGAFISMRDPMPNRKALVDIGAAGPLGGLAVTIPVALIGLYLTANGHPVSGPIPNEGAMALMIQPLYELLLLFVPMSEDMAFHPTAIAAWVGFLVTAINLLPVGQLDGGHIARGLFGEQAKYIGYATFGVLMLAAIFYGGWMLFALIVLLLGLRHPSPLNDISKIGGKTKAVGAISMAVLLFTFVPQPMMNIAPDHSFTVEAIDGNVTAFVGGYAEFTIFVNSTGNADSEVELSLKNVPDRLRGELYLSDGPPDHPTDELALTLPYDGGASVTVRMYVEPDAETGLYGFSVVAVSGDLQETLSLTVDAVEIIAL